MGQITIDEMHNSLFDYAQAVSDENLITESKTVVGAINEIYCKKLIANAIGEPLNSTDTYAKMNNDINNLLSTFKTNMMNNGITVQSGDKFKLLIDKIATMVEEGSGKGIQYASGDAIVNVSEGGIAVKNEADNMSDSMYLAKITDLGFKPHICVCVCDLDGNGRYIITSVYTEDSGMFFTNQTGSVQYGVYKPTESLYVSNDEITMPFKSDFFGSDKYTKYYAIGVGEEDTTIENSIISILKTKGYDESKDNIIDFIENKLYTKVIEPGTNVTIATGEGLESRRSENNQLFTKSLIVPSLSNLGSDNIKGLSLKVVSWAYRDDLYGPEQYSMSDGYFRIQIKRDGVIINNAFESSAYTYKYNNGNGTTHAYDLLDVQEGDVIEYTVGYYASGFLGTNVHEYHFGVKGAYLTYSIGYVTSL